MSGPRGWLVPTVLAVLAVSGCGTADETIAGQLAGHGGAGGGCAAMVVRAGQTYLGEGPTVPAERLTGEPLPAVRPACQDGNQGGAVPDETVSVTPMAGVDPAVAVAVDGHPYLRDGVPVGSLPPWLRRLLTVPGSPSEAPSQSPSEAPAAWSPAPSASAG